MARAFDSMELILQLSARDDRLEIRATSLRGEARGETTLPTEQVLEPLAQYPPGDYPESVVAPLGRTLWAYLLVGDVGRLATDLLGDALAARQPLQIQLRFDPDQVALAQFPWEMIRNDQGQFLVRDGLVDLTRYISYPQPPPVFDAVITEQSLLRVMAAAPPLEELYFGELGLPRLETLAHASFDSLSRKLLVEGLPLWGLQFDGHAGLMLQCRNCDTVCLPAARFCRNCGKLLTGARRVGALAFERDGKPDWVAAGEFGSLLYNARVRLAVLLACESARMGDRLVWSGLTPHLVLAGIPAVLGMQYPIFDDYANLFARTFYAALLRTNDVVAALRIARRADVREGWYSPVLYLRQHKRVEDTALPAPTYHERAIDTAVPACVQAGTTFLVRLWLRRPETQPWGEAELRAELGVPGQIPILTGKAGAAVKFEPSPGRSLRRGEVDVRLTGIGCQVVRGEIKLFVDEHLDAPPALLVVRATEIGSASLIFEVWQQGGVIASVVHQVEVLAPAVTLGASIGYLNLQSHAVGVERPAPLQPAPPPSVIPPDRNMPAPILPTVSVSKAAPGGIPWASSAVAAGGWGWSGALKVVTGGRPGGAPPALTERDFALGLVAGLAVAWGVRRAVPRARLGHLLVTAAGWAIAWVLLPLLVDALGPAFGGAAGRMIAAVISGGLGGTISGLALRHADPAIHTWHAGAIAAGWAFAFVIGQLINPSLNRALPAALSSAIYWSLIAAIGSTLMLGVINRRHA